MTEFKSLDENDQYEDIEDVEDVEDEIETYEGEDSWWFEFACKRNNDDNNDAVIGHETWQGPHN